MLILVRAVANELCAQCPSGVEGSRRVVEGQDGVAGQLVPVPVHGELAGMPLDKTMSLLLYLLMSRNPF